MKTLHNLFAEENIPDAAKQDLDELGALSGEKRDGRKKKAAETPEERIERMRREKKEHRAAAQERDDTEYLAVVVFRDRDEKERVLAHLGLDPNGRYADGRVFMRALGLEPAEAKAPQKKGKR